MKFNTELLTHIFYLSIMILLDVVNIANKNYLGLAVCSLSAAYWVWCITLDIKKIKTK